MLQNNSQNYDNDIPPPQVTLLDMGTEFDYSNWPGCGEIDIMELLGHEPEVTHGTVHYDNGDGYATTTGQKTLPCTAHRVD